MKPQIHRGIRTIRQRLDLVADRINASIVEPQVTPSGQQYMLKDLTHQVISGAPQHGNGSETLPIEAVFDFVKHNVQYRQDPRDYDYYMSAGRTLNSGAGDCFTLDTKIICRGKADGCYQLIRMGDLATLWPAFEALSYDFSNTGWVFKSITGWQSRGVKEIYQSHLGNGPSFRHTGDHEVWWYDGQNQSKRVVRDALGSRENEKRSPYRRTLVARKIPALNVSDLTEDQAYLAGIYTAEGYAHVSDRWRTCISQDKPEIRERIEQALAESGASFTESRRQTSQYYRVSGDLRKWFLCFGTNSFDMGFIPEVLSGSEESVRVLVEAHGDGDAYRPKEGSNWFKRVRAIHATSSTDLADDLQLALMILGEPWHTQLQMEHGGVGNSPIYRIHRWHFGSKADKRGIPELPDVGYSPIKSIVPAGEEEVADISVADTHNFVLSNGLIAKNCDDMSIIINGMLSSIGYLTGGRVISPDGNGWHIYSIVGVDPAFNGVPSAIVSLDAAYGDYAGWEPASYYRRYEKQCTFRNGKVVGFTTVRNG